MRNVTITHARDRATATCSACPYDDIAAGTMPVDLAVLRCSAALHALRTGHLVTVSKSETVTYEQRGSEVR